MLYRMMVLTAFLIGAATVHTGRAQKARAHDKENAANMTQDNFVGMWVTADGHIRHELLANGRYDEQRGKRRSAYQGRYTITGNHIDYVDDTGFTADGEFIDGVLRHAGMVLYREK